MIILGFPSNPTAQCVELDFLSESSRLPSSTTFWLSMIWRMPTSALMGLGLRRSCRYRARGMWQWNFFTMSKSYNMAGWRVGFMVGNRELVAALARIKSYHDYGTFTPIQVASVIALEGPQDCVEEVRLNYQHRRDVLCKGLHEAGWMVEVPRASMYVWAEIPEPYQHMGSLEFSKKLLAEAKVAVSPGVGFGEYGDDHVRFAMIENEQRTRQAVRGIKEMFRKDGLVKPSASAHGEAA